MSGRVLSIFYPPFEASLNDLTDSVSMWLQAQNSAPSPITSTGWGILEQDEASGEWIPMDELSDNLKDRRQAIKNHRGTFWDGTITMAGIDLFTRFSLFSQPQQLNTIGFTVTFGAMLHKQLYPQPYQLDAEAIPTNAIRSACLGITKQLGAEAFLVNYNDNASLCTFDRQKLLHGMLNPAQLEQQEFPLAGLLLAGILGKYVDRPTIARAWGKSGEKVVQQTTTGFILLNLL